MTYGGWFIYMVVLLIVMYGQCRSGDESAVFTFAVLVFGLLSVPRGTRSSEDGSTS